MYRLEHPEELAAKIYVVHAAAHDGGDDGHRPHATRCRSAWPSRRPTCSASASLAERDFWDEIETGDGTAKVPGRPFAGLGWRHLDRLHEPGEDTNAVSKEWLEGTAS